jgi:hypothetical protein
MSPMQAGGTFPPTRIEAARQIGQERLVWKQAPEKKSPKGRAP